MKHLWKLMGLMAFTAISPIEAAPSEKIRQIVTQVSAERLHGHVEKLSSIHSRHVASEGIWEAARYIRSEFEKSPRLQVELAEFEQPIRRLEGQTVKMANVVATLIGTVDPDRLYVVSGHYDSRASNGSDAEARAPGAVDDASGTAVVLELARILSGYEFEATLIFIAFTGEELGLLGSRHWAAEAAEQGLNVDAMITNDIVGNSRGGSGLMSNTSMRVFSEGVPVGEDDRAARLRRSIGGEVDSPARQLARMVKEVGESYVPGFEVRLIYRRDRFGRGGDHTSFSEKGYPAVRFSELYEDYRHQHQDVRVEAGIQYGDLLEFFDEQYAASVARINAAVLSSLADAPAAPQNVAIRGAVDYDTTLSWDPVKAADLAGYQIRVRDTDSAVWQKTIAAGNVSEYTLTNFVVDNHFFAVQAVDKSGNASRPVFPTGMMRR